MGDDMLLEMAKQQGYVPTSCTLNGNIVMGLVNQSEDPCKGCNGNRGTCNGRPKRKEGDD